MLGKAVIHSPTGGHATNNHPKKGERIAVDPIRRIKDIKAISKLTESNARNHLLFVMGINNGLRAGDLVRLKVRDVRYLKPGDSLTIKEGKTGKDNILVVNKTVYKALQLYLETVQPADDDYVFASRKGNSHIQSQAVSKLVKNWCKAINLRGNYGCHTLRKTWGYQQRIQHGVGFEILCKRYNHNSPAITMRYLGIEDREVHDVLMNEIG
ncbi:site-specific integrase [Desulfosarcina widdelii]|uniref:site-specific integrase n=1 Tax=Desulfosarcina widdelii TaxID=947919 RepID=UPI001E4B0EF4|nr:site-specific integrase [Desulfosarcina widdelii]